MKIKRTYNMSPESVATVKRLVEEEGVAPTQDAVVEQAIAEFGRRVRDAKDARLWELAGQDPVFAAEAQEIDTIFAEDDARAWGS